MEKKKPWPFHDGENVCALVAEGGPKTSVRRAMASTRGMVSEGKAEEPEGGRRGVRTVCGGVGGVGGGAGGDALDVVVDIFHQHVAASSVVWEERWGGRGRMGFEAEVEG